MLHPSWVIVPPMVPDTVPSDAVIVKGPSMGNTTLLMSSGPSLHMCKVRPDAPNGATVPLTDASIPNTCVVPGGSAQVPIGSTWPLPVYWPLTVCCKTAVAPAGDD